MPPGEGIVHGIDCLLALIVVGDVVLYLRLRQQGLHRVYRIFSVYLLFDSLNLVLSNVVPPVWYDLRHHPYSQFHNNVYSYIWAATEPIQMVLQLLIVLELYSLVLKNYKGVASMGRWAVVAGLGVAIVLSSLAVPAELTGSTQYPILRIYNVAIRSVDGSLVIFLLFIMAFLVWFPIPLTRNVIVYSAGYATYFTVRATAELASNLMSANLWNLVTLATLGVSLLCLAAWIVLLNREGETKKAVLHETWAPERQEHLMQQLAAINSSLMRSGPRP